MTKQVYSLPSAALVKKIQEGLKANLYEFALVGSENAQNTQLKELIESKELTMSQLQPYIYHRELVGSVYFDAENVLTYECSVSPSANLYQYTYAIALIDKGNPDTLLSITSLPQTQLPVGVGAVFEVKIAITSTAAEPVFINSGEFVTLGMLHQALLNQTVFNIGYANRLYEFFYNYKFGL